MKTFLIIDTFNFLHRAYHALPTTFRDANGEPVNAVYGVTAMLINVLNTVRPQYMVAALDSREQTFRAEEFTSYKAHRKPMDDDLASQIPKVFEILDAFGIKQTVVEGYEADDVIGTLVEKFSGEQGLEMVVVSNDRDLWQLTNGHVKIMVPGKKGAVEWIGREEAEKKFGFVPELIPDFKGLRGDPSDNIPGVYGVGEKTANRLIGEFGTVEEIYKNLKDVTPESLRKKLEENYEQALMSKKLAQIIMDVPFQTDLDECAYTDFNRSNVKSVLEKYNFKSLIKRLGFEVSEDGKGGSSADLSKSSAPVGGQMGLF
jgi:DNA polymerase I